MINFYEFTIKYCNPHIIIGKKVVGASIYYKNEKILDYSFLKKERQHSLVFVSNKKLLFFNKKIKELNEKHNTPDHPVPFLMRFFNLIEVEQVYNNAIKNNLIGVATLMDSSGETINAIVPIDSVNKNIEKTLLKIYASSHAKYYLKNEDFIWR